MGIYRHITKRILVENRIARNRGMLTAAEEERIFKAGRAVITNDIWDTFANISPNKLLPFLSKDKKVEGSNLKLATLQSLGNMKFVDLPLDENGINEVAVAIREVIKLNG